MKKILAWIAGIGAAIGAILLLLSSSRKKKNPISDAVAPDYKPEEFKKETAAKVEEVKAASKEEIVSRFKKRFGG